MGERSVEMAGGGVLTLEQSGSRIRLEARRREDGRGLYKVWLTGAGEGRLLLGTLVPEEGALRLRRTLSLAALEQAGCWPVRGAEVVLAFSFAGDRAWYCERRPGRLVEDRLLRQLLSRPMLCRRTEAGFELAAPFDPAAPVALNTLLCLARVDAVEGRRHFIWCFDASGRPLTHRI